MILRGRFHVFDFICRGSVFQCEHQLGAGTEDHGVFVKVEFAVMVGGALPSFSFLIPNRPSAPGHFSMYRLKVSEAYQRPQS